MQTSITRKLDALYLMPNEGTVTVGWVKALIEDLPDAAVRRVHVGSDAAAEHTATPDCYTAKQVAELLDLRVGRIYDLVAQGLIPVKRIGRQMRFPRAALLDWVGSGSSPLNCPNMTH